MTISSVFTKCLFISVLILILCTLLKWNKFLERIGPKCILALFCLLLVRMLLPFEFSYTREIWVEDVLSPVWFALNTPLFGETISFRVLDVLLGVWGIGIVAILLSEKNKYK